MLIAIFFCEQCAVNGQQIIHPLLQLQQKQRGWGSSAEGGKSLLLKLVLLFIGTIDFDNCITEQ